jgi:hypothetical protein
MTQLADRLERREDWYFPHEANVEGQVRIILRQLNSLTLREMAVSFPWPTREMAGAEVLPARSMCPHEEKRRWLQQLWAMLSSEKPSTGSNSKDASSRGRPWSTNSVASDASASKLTVPHAAISSSEWWFQPRPSCRRHLSIARRQSSALLWAPERKGVPPSLTVTRAVAFSSIDSGLPASQQRNIPSRAVGHAVPACSRCFPTSRNTKHWQACQSRLHSERPPLQQLARPGRACTGSRPDCFCAGTWPAPIVRHASQWGFLSISTSTPVPATISDPIPAGSIPATISGPTPGLSAVSRHRRSAVRGLDQQKW